MNLEEMIFERFRRRLPNRIDDFVVDRNAVQCIEMLEFFGEYPVILLDRSFDAILDELWDGDIHVLQRDDYPYGYTWIFDKRSGSLHTT